MFLLYPHSGSELISSWFLVKLIKHFQTSNFFFERIKKFLDPRYYKSRHILILLTPRKFLFSHSGIIPRGTFRPFKWKCLPKSTKHIARNLHHSWHSVSEATRRDPIFDYRLYFSGMY